MHRFITVPSARGTVMNLAFIFQFDDEFMITLQNDDIYVARINLDSSWILIFEWRLTGFIISMISKGAESLDSSPIRVMNLEFITHIRVMNAMDFGDESCIAFVIVLQCYHHHHHRRTSLHSWFKPLAPLAVRLRGLVVRCTWLRCTRLQHRTCKTSRGHFASLVI